MEKPKTIWSFDLGKGSIGEAVRDLKTNEFLHVESLLIPAEFASTKEATKRRRFMRTRLAHKMREQWLDEVWRKAGQVPLKGRMLLPIGQYCVYPRKRKKNGKFQRPKVQGGVWQLVSKGDERLEREFPKKGDSTCYTSCLLRIKLLRGEKLEPWQIYKALHSAIQRRGYDPKIPWKRKEDRNVKTKEADESDETQKLMDDFKNKLRGMIPDREDLQLPCYFDAWKMGLWNPEEPERLKERIDCQAKTTRDVIVPRELIEKEIHLLAEQASKQIEGLAGKAEELLYGPSQKAYASYFPELRKKHHLREGGANDWQGVLGQKIPRFDNRIIEKCALIRRLNVCGAAARPVNKKTTAPEPDSLLHGEVTFLMKLKNVRVLPDVVALTAKQIQTLLDDKRTEVSRLQLDPNDLKYSEKVADVYSYTKQEWSKAGRNIERGFNFYPYVNHEEIEAPKCGGRSRFSRPALRILRELILSGAKPSVFYARLIERDCELLAKLGTAPSKPLAIFDNCNDLDLSPEARKESDLKNRRNGLLVSDLNFLLKMRKAEAEEDSWEDLFIPNERLDGIVEEMQSEASDTTHRAKRDKAILEIIGSQNDPIVRHRLLFFWERLKTLQAIEKPDGTLIGEPERIILEFAREDFLGKKAKNKWKSFNAAKREQNDNARKLAVSDREQEMIKLWQDQGGECVYGKPPEKDGRCPYTQRGLPSPGTVAFEHLEIDHIVPRDMGGPNAYINKVLTFREVANREKKDRIPYVWFSQDRKDELDGYIRFVQSKKGSLGKKKVALLTRPDAADLVSKYTALAQTAWISRLAQTIIRLHFGWPLDHQNGVERVLTLTGGQTAQFRRDFRLNSLLGPTAKTCEDIADITKEEDDRIGYEIQQNLMDDMKKNRVDPRHHALDAMVLCLIPEWRYFQAKKWEFGRAKRSQEEPKQDVMKRPTPFFDAYFRRDASKPHLDNNSVRQMLARRLGEVNAEVVAFEKARLEETHYSKSKQQVDEIASKPLDALVFRHPDNPELREFDIEKLRRWLRRSVEVKQKTALEDFLASSPSCESWEKFKIENRKLFAGSKAKMRVPTAMSQYTVRKELRLLAYESNAEKKDTIFKPEWVRDDAENIATHFAGMAQLKADILTYLDCHPSLDANVFRDWIKQRCKESMIKTIRFQSFADEGEEAASKRRGESRKPDLFGCRQVPLAFAPKRLAKAFKDICDSWLRERLRAEFEIEGEGKKTTYRDFNRADWEQFCSSLRKPGKEGKVGPHVLKVTMLAGNADEDSEDVDDSKTVGNDDPSTASLVEDEFKESTKSPGAFFKGKAHQGYYLYVNAEGNWKRLPVYAHQSLKASDDEFRKLKERLSIIPGTRFKAVGFLQTGCLMELPNEGILRDRKGNETGRIPSGRYRLNTLNRTGQMKLTSQNGTVIKAQVDVFLAAELKRVH